VKIVLKIGNMPRSRNFLLSSPEGFFLLGGEAMSPIYAQPTEPRAEGGGRYVPYSRSDGGIDHLPGGIVEALSVPEIVGLRDSFCHYVSLRILDAAGIEAARQELADEFNRRKIGSLKIVPKQ
jgi:hypothetical protein